MVYIHEGLVQIKLETVIIVIHVIS